MGCACGYGQHVRWLKKKSPMLTSLSWMKQYRSGKVAARMLGRAVVVANGVPGLAAPVSLCQNLRWWMMGSRRWRHRCVCTGRRGGDACRVGAPAAAWRLGCENFPGGGRHGVGTSGGQPGVNYHTSIIEGADKVRPVCAVIKLALLLQLPRNVVNKMQRGCAVS